MQGGLGLGGPPATVPQALGGGCFTSVLPGISLGAFIPHRSVGMAKLGAGRLLEAEDPRCPGCNRVPSLVMLEEQKRLPATPSLDEGDHPAAAPAQMQCPIQECQDKAGGGC